MKNYKIVLQVKDECVLPTDNLIRVVKTVPASSKASALKTISTYEGFHRFNVISCEERKGA